MEITVNNQTFQVNEHCNILEMLSAIPNLPSKGLAVAINQSIVPKAEWSKQYVSAGDQVMIIKATQGG